MNKLIINIVKLLRPDQWVKNIFIFLPLLFSFDFSNSHSLYDVFIAFIAFSFTASSIYVINDLRDVEADRIHPKKKLRPLASGAVGQRKALVVIPILIILAISLFSIIDTRAGLVALLYFVMNLAYSFRLKYIPIVDVFVIATGFVLRLFVGAFATGCYLSQWIIIMTFLLALLLAFGKRRDDVVIFKEKGTHMRKSVVSYNVDFMNVIMTFLVGIIFIAYIMYCLSPEIEQRHGSCIYITSIFVLLGLIRYLQLIYVFGQGGNPTKIILTDRFMQVTLILWCLSFIIVVLMHKYYMR